MRHPHARMSSRLSVGFKRGELFTSAKTPAGYANGNTSCYKKS